MPGCAPGRPPEARRLAVSSWGEDAMLAVLVAATLFAQAAPLPSPGRGISEALARERAAVISDLRYELTFTVPERRQDPLLGRVVARFSLAAPHRIVLDFA